MSRRWHHRRAMDRDREYRRPRGLRALPGLLALVFLIAGPARAQDAAREVARRDLVDRAQAARDAGRHDEALELARRAGALRMTPSLRLFLAQQEEATGQLVAALADARQCARDAEVDASLAEREEVIATCRTLSAEIAPRLASVVVEVASPDGVSVEVAGAQVDPALYGVPMPVAPGHVVVEARTRDGQRFRRDLDLAAGATGSVAVELVAGPAGEAGVAGGGGPDPGLLGVGVAVGVLGLGGLATAGGLFALREDAVAARDAACDGGGCDPIAEDHHARAEDLNSGTNAALVTGAIVAAAGAAWIVVVVAIAPGAPAEGAARLRVGPGSLALEAWW